jgi:hypothetical protein
VSDKRITAEEDLQSPGLESVDLVGFGLVTGPGEEILRQAGVGSDVITARRVEAEDRIQAPDHEGFKVLRIGHDAQVVPCVRRRGDLVRLKASRAAGHENGIAGAPLQ